ncbi:MaoC family dehydratase [Nocardioides zeae]|uniref:MaoC family dehydratase n=1 Tax=Nocardioides imazamoxiresistens TaxID=3231893 RepID=A0ABU3PUA3_9ACTN|nr:MaoC family dehydratase [Nocardioides zeae]MDT9592805.1 MaoC family dehydratase [Nocardioides zeae]
MTLTTVHMDDLGDLVGRDLGPSSWIEVDQARIDAFAGATEDHQWIHTDPVRAGAGPFGTTIAHGFLTLALVAPFLEALLKVEGAGMGVNYGLDRVRFPASVPAGSRVRARIAVVAVDEVAAGVRQARLEITVEVEGGDRPVCVAVLLCRFYAPAGDGA